MKPILVTAAVASLSASASAQFTYDQSVEEIGTLWWPNVINLQFAGTPSLPSGDATLVVEAFGDFSLSFEFFNLSLDGGVVNYPRVFGDNFPNKNDYDSVLQTQFTIPQATLASMAGDGSIDITIIPELDVDNLNNDPDEFVRLRLVYDYVPAPGAAALLGLGAAASLRRRR